MKKITSNESENSAIINGNKSSKRLMIKLSVVSNILTPKKADIEWKTNKDEEIHKRGAENVYKSKADPRHTAKSVKKSSSSFKLFFIDKMMDNIVRYTKKNMQPVIDKFSEPLDGLTK